MSGGAARRRGGGADLTARARTEQAARVKHLREAGLVAAERRGTRLEVSVDRDAVAALGGDIGALVAD